MIEPASTRYRAPLFSLLRACACSVWLLAGVLFLGLPTEALAAERTDTPPMLKGDFRLGYAGSLALVGLDDRSGSDDTYTPVGRFADEHQGMILKGSFAAYHGIAVRLELPLTFYAIRHWESANDFIYDPQAGAPTAVGGQPLDETILEASGSARRYAGPGDFALGVRLVPFAERGVPGREAPATLALDVDVLAPSGGNHDTVREDGTAGPGRGGPQVRLGMTGSRRFGSVEPYVHIGYIHRGRYAVDLSDVRLVPSTDTEADGTTALKPSDEFTLRFGSEVIAAEDPSADTAMRLLLGMGFTYVGPNEVSSGTELPAPLAATVGHRARSGEHVAVDLALGLRLRTQATAEFFLDFGATWLAPHSLEQVTEGAYTVRTTPASFRLAWSLGSTFRFR